MKNIFSAVWFKCIAVLLCIALISGGLLAVLNDVLAVPASERTMRAIKKIYGEEKECKVVIDTDGEDESKKETVVCENYGTISKIFVVGDENSNKFDYLFYATGNNGYKNGTISLWVRVSVNSGECKIEKVLLGDFTKQTLMSKLGSEYYDGFTGGTGEYYSAVIEDGKTYAPVSGATKSATAASNAVNCVIYWLRGNVQ